MRSGCLFLAVVLVALFTPCGTLHAAVYVSEVAWMGSAENANAEWIELYNDGPSIDLAGWGLVAVDGQPSIELSGTASGASYILIERTSDDTVPGFAAGLVYTGALGNAGEVLVLTDQAGATIDRVDGSDEWKIGGDNVEKLTLQRVGGTGGWVTAAPTPGRPNASTNDTSRTSRESDFASSDTVPKKESATTAGKKDREVNLPPSPEPLLLIDIGGDRTVASGVPLSFFADLRNESGKPLSLNTVTWNFGDGATGEGQETVHTYLYPGEYVVRTRATRTLLRPPIVAEKRCTIRVVPLVLAVSDVDASSVEVVNNGSEVDLSGFVLVAGKSRFRIPDGTVLLSGARIRFPVSVTRLTVFDKYAVGLFTPAKTLAAQYGVSASSSDSGQNSESPLRGGVEGVVPESNEKSAEKDDEKVRKNNMVPEKSIGEQTGESTGTGTLPRAEVLAQVAHADLGNTWGIGWWLLALCAVVGVGVATVLFVRREQAEVVEGYAIEAEEFAGEALDIRATTVPDSVEEVPRLRRRRKS